MSEVKLYVLDLNSSDEAYPCRPATADEIKAAHPKCATCEHGKPTTEGTYCVNMASACFREYLDGEKEYCFHHTPKDGDEGAQS